MIMAAFTLTTKNVRTIAYHGLTCLIAKTTRKSLHSTARRTIRADIALINVSNRNRIILVTFFQSAHWDQVENFTYVSGFEMKNDKALYQKFAKIGFECNNQ